MGGDRTFRLWWPFSWLFTRRNAEIFVRASTLPEHLENPSPHPQAARKIAELEERYQISIPDEFRRYLAETAPREDFFDRDGNTWWSLDRIKSIYDECGPTGPTGRANPEIDDEAKSYLVFADFLIWCYAWAICCSNGPNRGRVAIIGDLREGFVANSFSQFVSLALEDSLAIHSAPSDRAVS